MKGGCVPSRLHEGDTMACESLPLPAIDPNLCTGCHLCVDACPTQALDQRRDKAFLRFPSLCTYCSACEDICPEGAIALPFLITFRR